MTEVNPTLKIPQKKNSYFTLFTRTNSIIIVFALCLLPTLLNFLGVDFSSQEIPVSTEKIATNFNATNNFLYVLSGAVHHIILEWSAVVLAMIAFIVSVMHYRINRDITIPFLTMGLFGAGLVDMFHTLAATRMLTTYMQNSNIIHFSWVFSRSFNALIMISSIILSLWLYKKWKKQKLQAVAAANSNNVKELGMLTAACLGCVMIAYMVVRFAAINENLPQTMFTEALITRPYDILPLALFVFAGALLCILYRSNPSLAKFGLLLSVIPEIGTQVHMTFGSTAFFDNHFNIAHVLKIIAYGIVLIGVLLDLNHREQPVDSTQIKHKNRSLNTLSEPENLLHVGRAKNSLAIQIPAAAFALSITIAVLVSILFYSESERLIFKEEAEQLSLKTKLVEPLIKQLYQQANSDVVFLSNTPPIMGLAKSQAAGDKINYALWKGRLEQIFVEFINAKSSYYKIRYIGVANNDLELVSVRRSTNKPIVVPKAHLQQRKNSTYVSNTIKQNLGKVTFSKITLNKENGKIEVPHKPVLRVSTPVFNPLTGQVFGLVIINVDFGYFIKTIDNEQLDDLRFYLANEHGDYIYHPDPKKIFGFDLGQRYLMQDEFPQLAQTIVDRGSEMSLANVVQQDEQFSGHYSLLYLDEYQQNHPLKLLLLKSNLANKQALADYRTRSILLGGALAIIALALAIILSRQVAKPLENIIDTLEEYNISGSLINLPIKANNEIGVVARNFHNLFARMNFALTQQTILADKAEQAMNKLNAVFNSAADAFITIDQKGTILSFNLAAETIFGYQQNQVIGKNIKMLMQKKEASRHDSYLSNYLITGIAGIIGKGRELKARRQSGEIFPIHLAISEVKTGSNCIFTGIIHDISKEKHLEELRNQKEQELEVVNERIALATEAAGIGIWQFDLVNQINHWDPRMMSLYGIDGQEHQNEAINWENFLHPDDAEKSINIMNTAVELKSSFDDEYRIKCPDGTIKHIKAVGVVKCNEHGEAVQIIGINYDISEIKTAEIAHIEARKLAENTVRHKTEFLASMSHEIRTPMNGVLGMLGLLLRSELSEDQLHRASLAKTSAESLLVLINDILDFSKVEAGKLDLEILDFNLRNLLGEFAETMALKAQEKELEVILDVSNIQISHVKGDPSRVRQILTNLVGNAIKFTPQGEIVIRAKITQVNEEELLFNCSVQDSGIGIPQDKMPSLFDSFTQVDASTTRHYGGTGLGLAISKQLCQLMQGDIWVTSEEGSGSCFSFNLKLLTSQSSQEVIPTVDIKGVHLLVVDDNQTNRMVLKEQFQLWGAKVTEAGDGLAALAILERADKPDFKVAFLDMQMPNMDGAELGEKIRTLISSEELKLVMMTSMATRGDASFFANLGFDAYFPKPATTSDLFNTLLLTLSNSDLLQKAEPLVTHDYLQCLNNQAEPLNKNNNLVKPAGIQIEKLQECRILLVEDNRINQEVAKHILSEMDINIDIAANGLEALEALRLTDDDCFYDIILMDCQMPEMDGYEATREIRKGNVKDVYKQVPIIAMTANAMKGDREKCIDAGMNDYLSKPIEPELLKEKLLLWFKPSPNAVKKSLSAAKKIEIETEKVITGTDIDESTSTVVVVWDKKALLNRVSQNAIIAKKLLQLFIEEMPDCVNKISIAYQQKNQQEMKNIVHKVKGMSANISAIELNEYIHLMEESISNNEMNDVMHQQFLQHYQRLDELLKTEIDTLDC